ncbi:hypothetical protein EYC84_008087 [Monilinia fructicola]|uniref:YEATS domain-containing protein n=1 Tax=Monilinia fructicola TaxID=38448 RepID=A0A5M9JIG8_MONFR|nr:hypothetical protein EYC84_008087 [Monilinia fructicola]
MVADVKRVIKLITEQRNIDKPALQEGFPMKSWNIEIYVLDEAGNERPATCFSKAVYNLHPTFPNPTQTFTEPPFRCENEGWDGPVPGDENGGVSRKKDADGKKRKRTGQIDMEKLAEGLIKLQEDDLLHVVQMIHDNKSEDTYTKNDIDQGEFHVDLYTLPESLVKMLWDFVNAPNKAY